MEKVSIAIYDQQNRLLKRFRPRRESDLCYRHEMLAGVRFIELRAQLNRLMASGDKRREESHSLFCSYEKFGACQQQQADFRVVIRRV